MTMDENEDYGGSIFEGAAGYGGFGDEQEDVAPENPAPQPQPAPPPVQQPPVPVQPPVSQTDRTDAFMDTVSTLLGVAGGAALGYYAAPRSDERAKWAGMGAAAGYFGVFGILAFGWWASREKGRLCTSDSPLTRSGFPGDLLPL